MERRHEWEERIKYKLAWIAYIVHTLKLNRSRWPRNDTDIKAWIQRCLKYKEDAHNGHHYTHEGTHAEESRSQAGEAARSLAVQPDLQGR